MDTAYLRSLPDHWYASLTDLQHDLFFHCTLQTRRIYSLRDHLFQQYWEALGNAAKFKQPPRATLYAPGDMPPYPPISANSSRVQSLSAAYSVIAAGYEYGIEQFSLHLQPAIYQLDHTQRMISSSFRLWHLESEILQIYDIERCVDRFRDTAWEDPRVRNGINEVKEYLRLNPQQFGSGSTSDIINC
jgi:hypothetical protein